MKPALLTRDNVIARTCYGQDVYCHILRKSYPGETVMKVSGDDCGWLRNPWDHARESLHVFIRKIDTGEKLPRRIACHHDTSGHIPDGDFLDFAAFHYGKTGDELLQILNQEMYLDLGEEEPRQSLFISEPPAEPAFSFFKAPIKNTIPNQHVTITGIYKYITGHYAARRTEELRRIRDPHRARAFKAARFDYVTFSGTFSSRKERCLLHHSGLICLDFDHVRELERLFARLVKDEYFDTQLLFRSPSGDGLKWVIPIDLMECPHIQWFNSISAYVRQTYGAQVDPSGKDVCRACFLPHDPRAYLNPNLAPLL